ncbi:hypothetical protein [Pseudonocardia asaccharolytica]|uniref:hypothetical protein n=1 Tax=Pseudonocardia asaccharolytica TaxID=54010 RepID=UPI0004268FA1|nr:hypothetical protein [Pseudonocardia asaccharolytica]
MAALLVVIGCAPAPGGSGAPGAPQAASLTHLVRKLGSIAKDECQTHPAADIYPRCARFVAQVENAAAQARSVVEGRPQEATIDAAAGRVGGAIDRFTGDGCLPGPGGEPPSSPEICGPDLARLQEELRGLLGALGPAR